MANVELTQAQTRELQALDQAIIALQTTLDRAERAGLDVADLKRRLADANSKRIGMLREFTPGAAARQNRQ